MKNYSMNDEIYFRLTDAGRKILHEQATEFHRNHPEVDIKYSWVPFKGDVYREQLWAVVVAFGNYIGSGNILPIFDISFTDPTVEE